MNLVTIVFRCCRLIALGAFFLVAPMASVSQAAVVAADTFTRANSDDLGSTEVGDFAWGEFYIQNLFGNPDVAQITNNEFELTADWGMAAIDVGLSDLTVSADLRFVGSTTSFNTKTSAGMIFRMSDPELAVPGVFNRPENLGLIQVWFTSSGGLLIGENTSETSFAWYYIDNPFFEGEVAPDRYPPPGTLPTEINGAPFDANGNGRLDADEPFQVSAVLSGTNLDVKINGETIKSTSDIGPLANTSGASANDFAFEKWFRAGGEGDQPTVAFDNLIIEGDAPLEFDFDMDGDGDGNDILLAQQDGAAAIATAQAGYGTGVGAVSAVGAVPEPSTLALLSLALGAISLRRNRS